MSYLSSRIKELNNREYLSMGRSVNFLPIFTIDDNTSYCLVGTQVPKFEGGSQYYCLGGWTDEDDTSYLDTILRELQEETNLDISGIRVITNIYKDMEIASGYSDERNSIYIIEFHPESIVDLSTNDPDEITKYALINLSTLDRDTIKDKQLMDAIDGWLVGGN